MKSRAISIDIKKYNSPLNIPIESSNSVTIELYLTPTDVPQYIYSKKSDDGNELAIIFKYPNDEKEDCILHKENVRFYIGNQSGKPMRIQILNIQKDHIDKIQLKKIITNDVKFLLDNKQKEEKLMRRKSNFRITSEVLEENSDKFAETINA